MARKGLEIDTKSGIILVKWPDPRPTGLDLYAFREKVGITQHQAAEYFNCSRTTIGKYEKLGHTFLIPNAPMAREIDSLLRLKIKHPAF